MRMGLSPVRALGLLLVLCLCIGTVQAQILSGTLSGTVYDPQGGAIPGASIKATDKATGRVYEAKTGDNGSFSITNLPNSDYEVVIEAAGFAKLIISKVTIQVSQTAQIAPKMEIAAGKETVTVVDSAVLVNTETAELKFTITRAQILQLPLPTRNPLDLVRTLPGIANPTTSSDSFVHGLRGNSTNLTQDGVNVADNFVKTSSFFAISAPTVDSTGEFSATTGGVGVDAGFGGAQVSLRTQRGSNAFHGSLFWFQRTSAFAANLFFNKAVLANQPSGAATAACPKDGVLGTCRPFQLQNRIGANAGGPVYIPHLYDGRNRTWVFGTFEAFRQPLSVTRDRTVLTQEARNGIFRWPAACTASGATACPAGITPGQLQTINDILPLGTIGVGGPAPSINAAVMNFYNSIVPLPNTALCGDNFNTSCFSWNIPGLSVQNRYILRADHQLFTNHALEFVYSQADFDTSPDFLNGIEPQFPGTPGGGQVSRRQVITGAWHSTFGNTKGNEFRIGFQRAPVAFDLFESYAGTGNFQVDFAGVTDPILVQQNLPQGRNTPVRQIIDNFSWQRGRHTFRIGGEYRQIVANNFFFNVVVPRTTVAPNGLNAGNPNGISSSDFGAALISSTFLTTATNLFTTLTGLRGLTQQGFNFTSPTSGYVPGVPRVFNPIQNNIAFYFQDSFKWMPNLTITYGTRWEYQGVFDDRNQLVLSMVEGRQGIWGPTPEDQLFTPGSSSGLSDSFLDFGGGRNGRPLYNQDMNNFAPFLGFAWDPFKDGKTSVRGNFSVAYTQDGFTSLAPAITGNTGLFSVFTNNNTTGVFSTAGNQGPVAVNPTFPLSNTANSITNNGGVPLTAWYFNQDLSTPYVMSWSLGVQRELWKRIAVEARYVGNRANRLYRAIDLNEIDFLHNPFTCPAGLSAICGASGSANVLTEFRNAQNNLAICTANRVACTGSASGALRFNNVGIAGQVPLPIFDALFNRNVGGIIAVAPASGYQSTGFVTNLQQNTIGSMFNTLRTSNTYRLNRDLNFVPNFFVANPFVNVANVQTNGSWSYYHGLEFEVRRQFASGLFFGGNYTFSRVITDTRFLTSQSEFQEYRNLLNPSLDRNRAAFDVQHSFSANFIYPLPFGKGKTLLGNANSIVDKLVGGWSVQGFSAWSSGSPFTVSSGRATTGSLTGQTAVLRNMTVEEFQKQVGVFRTDNQTFWLNPDSGLFTRGTGVGVTTSFAVMCTAGQTTPCFDHPGPGEEGNMPFFGVTPGRFFNQNFSVIKKTGVPSVSESFNFEIRFEFFNAFNSINFGGPSAAITSTSFGQYGSAVDTARGGGATSRLIQWAIRVNW